MGNINWMALSSISIHQQKKIQTVIRR